MGHKEGHATDPIINYFKYEHLPEHLQEVSKPFCHIAARMNNRFDASAERAAGLRKLLEAKDCFVRAALSE